MPISPITFGRLGGGYTQQGMQNMQTFISNAIKNQYLEPGLKAALANAQAMAQQEQAKAKYADPQALAELMEKQQQAQAEALKNKYYEPDILSQIQNRNAQSNLFGEQAKYFGPSAEAEIAYKKAEAEKARLANINARANAGKPKFTDPMLKRGSEFVEAVKTGAIPIEVLDQMGLGDWARTIQASMGQGGTPAPTGMGAPQPGGQAPGITPPSAAMVSPGAGAPTNNNFANWLATASPTGISPKMQEERQKAEIKEDISGYSEGIEKAHEAAKNAGVLKLYVDQFRKNYKETSNYLKGPVFGHIYATSAHARLADQAAQNIQAGLLPMFKGQRGTLAQLKLLSSLKFTRDMPAGAARTATKLMEARADRDIEYEQFLRKSQSIGIPYDTAQTLWSNYENDKPIYDVEKNRINEGNKNKWGEYLTPKKINEAAVGQEQPTGKIYTYVRNGQKQTATQEELENTAKMKNLSVEQVKQILGITE